MKCQKIMLGIVSFTLVAALLHAPAEMCRSIEVTAVAVDAEEEVLKAFKVFDKEGNGLININELKDIMLNFGNNWSEEELNEMFKEADIDMDGYLNYEEFVRTKMSK